MPLEVIVHKGPKTEIVESPIPTPGEHQLVIKVVVSGSNPKDWKRPQWMDRPFNEGDDIAGIVHEVGKNVTEFKAGDRVAAFHEMGTPHGSYGEYALAWDYTTFHISEKVPFEEAATIPLAAGTAVVGLFARLGLPDPWTPVTSPTPLIIYGGASAVGAFAIKLARRANIHPIIAVAGQGIPYVETLIDRSKGDTIIDYRQGNEAVVDGIKKVLQQSGNLSHAPYALDAVAQYGSVDNIAKVLDPQGGHTTFVLPHDKTLFPSTVHQSTTMVGSLHQDQPSKDLGYVYFRYIAKGLDEGWFSGHPFQVRDNGLEGVEGALQDLKDGKASAVKYVFRIADTPKLKAGL